MNADNEAAATRLHLSRMSFWSSLAMVPATVALLDAGAWAIFFVYASSLLATLAYHATAEKHFIATDRALAYGVIFCNCWMTFETRRIAWAIAGIACVFVALVFYRMARIERDKYDLWHSVWHLFCGGAGICFVLGYAP